MEKGGRMERENYQTGKCLFKERYRFDLCINCSGYSPTRVRECKHYLPKFKVLRKITKEGLREAIDFTIL